MPTTRERKAEGIPQHYPAVLGFGLWHRFFAHQHLRRRFPEHIGSDRTARRHLLDLRKRGLVDLVPIQAVRPTHEHVYFVTGRGITELAQHYENRTGRPWNRAKGQRRRPSRGYSLQHIDHELLTTDLDVAMWQTTVRRPEITLHYTERWFNQPAKRLAYSGEDGITEHYLEPDAGYHVVHQFHSQHLGHRRSLDLCLVEVDRGTMSVPTLMREKFARYQAWAASSASQQYLSGLYSHYRDNHSFDPRFRLLVVVEARAGERDDTTRLTKLLTETLSLAHDLRRHTWFCTAADLIQHLDDSDPLAAPIWVRGKHIGRHLAELQSLPGRSQQQHFMAHLVANELPRITLFPPPRN